MNEFRAESAVSLAQSAADAHFPYRSFRTAGTIRWPQELDGHHVPEWAEASAP
jgi:hypothetical protein